MGKFINPFTDVGFKRIFGQEVSKPVLLERMPWMAQNAVFQRLSEIADVASLNKEERIKYDANMKAFRDTIAVMEGQYLEGRAEGEQNRALESARRMKADGMPAELIAKYTGLTKEAVEKS